MLLVVVFEVCPDRMKPFTRLASTILYMHWLCIARLGLIIRLYGNKSGVNTLYYCIET